MSNKSKIENNNTKSGFCRKGGSRTYDKAGKLIKDAPKRIEPKTKIVKKESKKPVEKDNNDGGK